MSIAGPFLSVEELDTFFFMRGFPSMESREELKSRFYESRLWKERLEEVLMQMLEEYDVVVFNDPGGNLPFESMPPRGAKEQTI